MRLKPNEATSITLTIDRKGNDGPIRLSLDALPAGIEGTAQEIAEGASTGVLTLRADPSLGDTTLTATCIVTATVGTQTARLGVPIQVSQVPRPTLSTDTPLILQPGMDVELPIPVLRNGWDGAITLAVEQCPEGITASVADVAPEADSVRVRIAVTADVAEQTTSFRLAWDSSGRKMTADVPTIVSHHPFAVESPIAIALTPLEPTEARIRLKRSAYEGPVSLSISGLPDEIRASVGSVHDARDEGTLTVLAGASARGHYVVSDVHATAGHLEDKGLCVIRVLDDIPASALPPAVVTALSGMPRPKPGGIEARLSEDAKESLDRFYGTTSASKQAVVDGLRWLASVQNEDGSWASGVVLNRSTGGVPQSLFKNDGRDDLEGRTALAVLPFLAEGISHEQKPDRPPEFMEYTDVVKKALLHLARKQVPAAGPGSGRAENTLRSQILSVRAFSEAYALSDNAKLKPYAKDAADYLIEQQSKNGGWGAEGGANALDTAQALVALRLARACRIGVSSLALRRGEKFLSTCSAGPAPNNDSMYALQPGDLPDADATAAGLLAILYATPHPSPAIVAGCGFFLEQAPTFRASHTNQSGLFLLLATHVLQNIEGEQFDRWNASIRMFLTANQINSGDQAGSWDPESFGSEADAVQASSLAILCLQANYRYLPLFRTANGAREERPEGSSEEAPDEPAGK
jgi:hypothetical protein